MYSYTEELKLFDHGSTIDIKLSGEDGKLKFKYKYICFATCEAGWKVGCRLILCTDGCFLKGMCKGQLLCVIGKDGNNQMFPMAWGCS